MSIKNAITLINDFDLNKNLRATIYSFEDNQELEDYLHSKGYTYTNDEFEDAVNSMHVECQTLENAQLLLEKAELLRYLLFINAKISI